MIIQDCKACHNPQTQTFTYDELDRTKNVPHKNNAGDQVIRTKNVQVTRTKNVQVTRTKNVQVTRTKNVQVTRLISAVAMNGANGTYALQNYTYSSSTGNLASKAGISYTYGDTNHDHAVTAMGSDSFTYDANGNQVTRNVSGSAYTLGYDAENRLVNVSGAATATFVYDGDGNRVKATVAGATTTYIGSYFEWTGSTSTMKKYYYGGNTRVAMRTGSSTINYLLGDHLGSTAITTNSSGVKSAEIRYYPWGTTRYTSGTTPTTQPLNTRRVSTARWSE